MNSQRPLVSVCISAYNVERFLAEALQSVLEQSYRELEVILFDNGSVDRTFDVARSFDDPRLRCLRIEQNMGAYEAMNHIASMATGEFVAIYHSDDVYEPTIVEREVAHLVAHPEVAAVFCKQKMMDESGRIFGEVPLPRQFAHRDSLGFDEIMHYTARRKNALFVCPTFMTRRELFRKVGGFRPDRYGIATDLEMWLRIARRYPVAILDDRLFRYRRGSHQWSARYMDSRVDADDTFLVMDEYMAADNWGARLTPGDRAEYEFHRGDDATYRAANFVRRGEPERAIELLRAHPFPWRCLLAGYPRRKLRNLVLRTMIRSGVTLGAVRPLSLVLERIGP